GLDEGSGKRSIVLSPLTQGLRVESRWFRRPAREMRGGERLPATRCTSTVPRTGAVQARGTPDHTCLAAPVCPGVDNAARRESWSSYPPPCPMAVMYLHRGCTPVRSRSEVATPNLSGSNAAFLQPGRRTTPAGFFPAVRRTNDARGARPDRSRAISR